LTENKVAVSKYKIDVLPSFRRSRREGRAAKRTRGESTPADIAAITSENVGGFFGINHRSKKAYEGFLS